MNVEPAPHYIERLRAARPADVNLEVGVGRTAGSRVFHEIDQTGLSTLRPEIAAEHHAAGFTVRRRQIELTTLSEICRQYAPGPIHFLKIDVEGAEDEVLAGADFARFRPWIVLLEATKPLSTDTAADWEPALLAAGYIFVLVRWPQPLLRGAGASCSLARPFRTAAQFLRRFREIRFREGNMAGPARGGGGASARGGAPPAGGV